ncbi:helicase-exonuclease AddAB subunit AddA [Fredinandcohnia quinoae]|uniref:ATP-dependent helicase/nuclease subunit A n=1 Tax=Fredinandcohnia quinoae TaxID=2918902 RepID=A0AAW5E741_9BACI|nr:helicase-exonuclease AddAB subunit AddA [Fredinandcohnia sp. SECRCQ15]MCH1625821.1 helicase-exonuclease AddAB subunit AddA [Fredinandcohnia sp. SECRCQ15]
MSNIVEKPEGSQWTDDQWRAIVSCGQDILVAAAAGSGKTAVLVERIIKKILSKEITVDVDRLLVVTFTNASAAEMRNRVGEALEKALKEEPGSLHLRRQLSLLNRASISTIHSFCLEVIRKFYYLIDIDPGFRIADSTEAELLRDEVMEELFEEHYSNPDNIQFFDLVDRFTNDRTDTELQNMIRKLYEFSRAHPSPNEWLRQIAAEYEVDERSLEDTPYIPYLLADISLQLEGVKANLLQGLDLTREPGGPAPRAETIETDLEQIYRLLHAKDESWTALYEAMQNVTFKTAKSCKGDEYDEILLKQVTKLRDDAKKQVQKLKEDLFSRKPESYLQDIIEMQSSIGMLIQLVIEFGEQFQKVKEEKGLVDFSDLEHYCLNILRKGHSDTGKLIPSEAALEYRVQFEEVLVDEYQDTNMVQESILQLVTKEGEVTGNLFMVGDVKQSIYRFRLAEPLLFLSKYKRFTQAGEGTGIRIDLSKNFRSRAEILDGTNYLFKQLMGETVGEIIYDEDAELKLGASYPVSEKMAAELLLIDKNGQEEETVTYENEDEGEEQVVLFDKADLETAQLEARAMAKEIKEMISSQFQIYDRKQDRMRSMTYRDVVILMRSMPWASQIMEEFKQQGIPIYADLSTGYFEATEVSIMMSLLKVIDNPYQDIPLASVLRSPIVGLDAEELAIIRTYDKNSPYYEALKMFIKDSPHDDKTYQKLKQFHNNLEIWRTKARNGALSELIWQLYRDTYFYDFVGGMPGGKQRQANLRALYDRARQYEATSFRGLFRFLRFIERMQDRGDDLGTARALGEQEDVVRLMTIHKSKGLEFPVVFVAGLSKQFNMMDLNKKYLLDKELGFGSKYVNPKLRISYPTLPMQAIKKKMHLELIAEEMRVLYVALTRAKEKLYLVGTVKDLEKQLVKWQATLANKEWLIADHTRAGAKNYLDWIGPALVRHRDCQALRGEESTKQLPDDLVNHPAKWEIRSIASTTLHDVDTEVQMRDEQIEQAIIEGEPVPVETSHYSQIKNQLTWSYSYLSASNKRSKQSVSEIKRQRDQIDENSDTAFIPKFRSSIADRPRFMQQKSLTAAERGTAMHMVMQHVNFKDAIHEDTIHEQIAKMVNQELLTPEQAGVIDIESVIGFFNTSIAQRMMRAEEVCREVPFSVALPASVAYADWTDLQEENVLIQGVIDCIFEDEEGIVLIDYKTDTITGRFKGGFEEAKPVLEDRYRVQLELYSQAIEHIWKKPLKERYLYFFDGGYLLEV